MPRVWKHTGKLGALRAGAGAAVVAVLVMPCHCAMLRGVPLIRVGRLFYFLGSYVDVWLLRINALLICILQLSLCLVFMVTYVPLSHSFDNRAVHRATW
jgi:hypothetical protein